MAIPKEFLRQDKIKAICLIHNLKSDEYYLYKTLDAVSSYKDERFKLDLAIHPCCPLQEAYTSLGLESFIIEIYKEVKEEINLDKELLLAKELFLKEGKRLYNN